MGLAGRRRRITVALAAVLAVVAAAAVFYRVLAPAEVDTIARGAYPPVATPQPGVIGRLPVAPLIVDGRLRVYAGNRQVYADQPVDGRHRVTPFWSYRRWPARLVGVLGAGTTVVSRWSDGELVALDARTGRVAWRAEGPPPGSVPQPRRTYAATVWDPAGLYVAPADGGSVLVVAGVGRLDGYDLADGRRLWRVERERGCIGAAGTTATGEVLGLDACDGPETVEFRDAATGAVHTRWQPPDAPDEFVVTPLGCRDGRSACRGLRTSGPGDESGRGWLLVGAGAPTAAPALDGPDTALDGEQAVGSTGGVVTGRAARSGKELWRRTDLGQARILAVEPGRVHLLTEGKELVTLDPVTGAERSRFVLDIGRDGTGWAVGRACAVDGYVAVERLRPRAGPEDDDQAYFLTAEAVLLAAT